MSGATEALRPDLALVASEIPARARVLDIGCGSGTLLAHLMAEQHCTGTGIEIDHEKVVRAIRRGVPVIELDLDEQLTDFGDGSYDVCVLSRTIQTIQRPAHVLEQMGRIAGHLIVSVPNFGWWGHRLRLLAGSMPKSRELPFEWYDTPNIRHTTLRDLETLFDRLNFRIERRYTYTASGRRLRQLGRGANLLAGAAIYVLRPTSGTPTPG
ncbi:methionine biosynthesis protein MetW [Nigerium massiliense]|uniref:methionine biosynthesis protein MetW n=1 Tax=Nigerium massiliense TaxID=1522317 RepID=UPI00058CC944|nr:methionine biosynthesis protein MetW [Nigerium massiliense]